MAERLSTGLVNEMVGPGGSSFADALEYGVIRGYSGTQPADADAAEQGTLLVEWTKGSAAATTPMTVANGLTFDAAVDGESPKTDGQTWSGVAVATGTLGWFRHYAAPYTLGASTTAVRMDGAISTSGAEMNIANTGVTSGGTSTLDSASISIPTS